MVDFTEVLRSLVRLGAAGWGVRFVTALKAVCGSYSIAALRHIVLLPE